MGSKSSRQYQDTLKNDILNLLSELNNTNINNENALKSIMIRFDILLVRWRKREYLYLTRVEGYSQVDAQRRLRRISPKFFFHTEPGMEPPRYIENENDINNDDGDEPKLTTLEIFLERHMHIIKFLEHSIN
jgi:hypothetical protein